MADQRKSTRIETMPGEVILEFIAIGTSVKVSAVHVETGEEVSIVGPANALQRDLEASALAKLRYVLEKKGRSYKRPGIVI